jgi:hypothetical protein
VQLTKDGSRKIIVFVQCLSCFIMTLGETTREPVHLYGLVCEFLNNLCIFSQMTLCSSVNQLQPLSTSLKYHQSIAIEPHPSEQFGDRKSCNPLNLFK